MFVVIQGLDPTPRESNGIISPYTLTYIENDSNSKNGDQRPTDEAKEEVSNGQLLQSDDALQPQPPPPTSYSDSPYILIPASQSATISPYTLVEQTHLDTSELPQPLGANEDAQTKDNNTANTLNETPADSVEQPASVAPQVDGYVIWPPSGSLPS